MLGGARPRGRAAERRRADPAGDRRSISPTRWANSASSTASAPIAFIGGSLVPHGGQNPIEPIRLDAVVLHGPHVHNFAEIYAALDRADPAGRVADAASLAARCRPPPRRSGRAAPGRRRCAAALEPFSGALEETMRALAPFLASPAQHERRPLAAAA